MIAAENDAATARAELAPLAAEVAECRVRAVSSNSPPLPLGSVDLSSGVGLSC